MVAVAESTTFTLTEMKALLETTEGLTEQLFELDGSITFAYDVEAEKGKKFTVKIGGNNNALTQDAALQAFKTAKVPTGMVDSYDLDVLVPLLNWWFSNAGGEMKALTKDSVVVAFIRPGTEIYTTSKMLSEIVRALTSQGVEEDTLKFDKVHHDLNETQFCLIIPNKTEELENGDVFQSGVQLQHSTLGGKATIMSAYTSRALAGNGHISVGQFDQWNRKLGKKSVDGTTDDDVYDVYTWSFDTADSIWRGFKHEVAALETLTEISVGSHAGTFFNDVFTKYSIPTSLRKLVREEWSDQLGTTIYDLWNAVTAVADRTEVEGHTSNIRKMMEVGGELAQHPHQCPQCHRMKEQASD